MLRWMSNWNICSSWWKQSSPHQQQGLFLRRPSRRLWLGESFPGRGHRTGWQCGRRNGFWALRFASKVEPRRKWLGPRSAPDWGSKLPLVYFCTDTLQANRRIWWNQKEVQQTSVGNSSGHWKGFCTSEGPIQKTSICFNEAVGFDFNGCLYLLHFAQCLHLQRWLGMGRHWGTWWHRWNRSRRCQSTEQSRWSAEEHGRSKASWNSSKMLISTDSLWK